MKSKSTVTHRRLLIAPMILLLAQACATAPPESGAESEGLAATTEAKSTRRIFKNCDPAEKVEGYADLVGEKVLIDLAWEDEKAKSAQLQIPAKVLRIESPYVVVDFDKQVPNLQFYVSVWLYSGHVKAMADGPHGVDPCSATMKKGQW